jgi:hypothetical protein
MKEQYWYANEKTKKDKDDRVETKKEKFETIRYTKQIRKR